MQVAATGHHARTLPRGEPSPEPGTAQWEQTEAALRSGLAMCLKIFGGAQNDFKETLLQGMAAVNSEQTIRGGVTGEEADRSCSDYFKLCCCSKD